jgi:hemerythrin-like domain-containing protein
LKQIVRFIQGFADKCHHAKEEDLLFPAMEEAGVPRQGGPIGVMLAEHTEGREHVRRMKEAAERYAAGDLKAGSEFAGHARQYAALLSQHIHKEDNILYPIADARLSARAQVRLEKDFEKVEEEVVGAGKHEEYHRLLEKLEKTYF